MNRTPKPDRHRTNVHNSAIDSWIAVLLFLPAVMATVLGVYLAIIGEPGDASVLFIAAAAALLITTALTLPCRYTILKDAVSIRCGLICYQVPLDEIEYVRPSGTWRSGPALSLKRVVLKTAHREYIVSPKDRDRFTKELEEAMRSARS